MVEYTEKEKWIMHAVWCGEYDTWTADMVRARAEELFPEKVIVESVDEIIEIQQDILRNPEAYALGEFELPKNVHIPRGLDKSSEPQNWSSE